MKNVIITGVTGFIGGALAKKLLDSGVTVFGVDIETPKLEVYKSYKNFIPIIADFTKYKELPALIQGTINNNNLSANQDFDAFYHFAWMGGFTTAIKDYTVQLQNAAYAGDAIIAAKEIGVKKFIYANTYNQYEIRNFLENVDSFEPRYTCIYSTGKTAANLICKTLAFNNNIEYVTGLIPMPYGEGNYSKQLANIVIDNLNKGKAPKLIEGNNLYDLVYIGDIADAFIAIGEKGKNLREYYIGHRKLKTFRKWIEEIRDVIAPNVELKFGDYKDNQQINYSMIDLDKLYNDTGWQCSADFNETIKKSAAWVKSLNWE